MRTLATLTIATLSLLTAAVSAKAQYYYDDEPERPIFYRNGMQCQEASSGRVICRPIRREHRYGWGGGYGYGRGDRGGYSQNPIWYENGRQCQQASSGRIICR